IWYQNLALHEPGGPRYHRHFNRCIDIKPPKIMEDPRLEIPGLPFFPEFEQSESMIKPFLLKLLSKWYWFVISIIVFLSAAYVLTRYSTPVYQSSSSLLIL